MRHPPLPLSTMPCADRPRLLPDPCRIELSPTPTSPHSIQFESEEGTPTLGNAGLSSATPRRGGGDRAGKPVRSQPERDRGQASHTQSPPRRAWLQTAPSWPTFNQLGSSGFPLTCLTSKPK